MNGELGESEVPEESSVPDRSEPSIFDQDGALTRDYLLSRGFCCGNACRNCPYGHEAVKG